MLLGGSLYQRARLALSRIRGPSYTLLGQPDSARSPKTTGRRGIMLIGATALILLVLYAFHGAPLRTGDDLGTYIPDHVRNLAASDDKVKDSSRVAQTT